MLALLVLPRSRPTTRTPSEQAVGLAQKRRRVLALVLTGALQSQIPQRGKVLRSLLSVRPSRFAVPRCGTLPQHARHVKTTRQATVIGTVMSNVVELTTSGVPCYSRPNVLMAQRLARWFIVNRGILRTRHVSILWPLGCRNDCTGGLLLSVRSDIPFTGRAY